MAKLTGRPRAEFHAFDVGREDAIAERAPGKSTVRSTLCGRTGYPAHIHPRATMVQVYDLVRFTYLKGHCAACAVAWSRVG